MAKWPSYEARSPLEQLEPVFHANNNLHAYLAGDPKFKSILNNILYLPGRTLIVESGNASHCLAFGPTHQYADGRWTSGSDLASLHGGTRELFLVLGRFVVYAGTHKCRQMLPRGSHIPPDISLSELRGAALGGASPPDADEIMNRQFPEGITKVDAIGLQCIGFNGELYDSLRDTFAQLRVAKVGKRKAQGEGGREDRRMKTARA
ncbi:hypothetical protein C8J57DRAFT_627568 [Mycena rebaudengoi]|nr:hypothetical protein C8J57DRAFT_627568 [Mycena rebaudengoi]